MPGATAPGERRTDLSPVGEIVRQVPRRLDGSLCSAPTRGAVWPDNGLAFEVFGCSDRWRRSVRRTCCWPVARCRVAANRRFVDRPAWLVSETEGRVCVATSLAGDHPARRLHQYWWSVQFDRTPAKWLYSAGFCSALPCPQAVRCELASEAIWTIYSFWFSWCTF